MTIRLGQGSGPMRGVRVIEIGGIGPGPHACMMFADLSADVLRIERPEGTMPMTSDRRHDLLRGRPSVALDLKHPAARSTVLELVGRSDVLVEGMRPGAMERLGLGPEECREVNPRLVYARMTGWGQDGPLAHTAGHDLGYVAVSGTLHGLGQDPDRPHFPSNLLGDFGGGSSYLVIGVLAALLERSSSGLGDVVDVAILDGVAHLSALTSSFLADGRLEERRAANLLDGGRAYYDLYETADGEHLAVAPIEPQFYAALVHLLDLEVDDLDRHSATDRAVLRHRIATRVRGRTRAEWTELLSAATPASRRCSGSARRRPIPTSRTGECSSSARASSSRLPRLDSNGPAVRSACRPPGRASTPSRRSMPGASKTSTRCSPTAPPCRPNAPPSVYNPARSSTSGRWAASGRST